MPKFTGPERIEIQSIVASLTIKRIPDELIIKHIFNQTKKSISARSLWNIRQRLKRGSYVWYSKLREGEYEYIHEFKERINEIVDLQRRHYKIIAEHNTNPELVNFTVKFDAADSPDGQRRFATRGQFGYDQFVNWTFDDLYKLHIRPWKELDPNEGLATRMFK